MRFAFALAAAIAFAFTSSAQAAEPLQTSPLEIEPLAEHPAMDSMSLSPDGKHMAGLVKSAQHKWPVVSIWDVENLSKPPIWIPSARMRPRSVAFLGNNHIIFFADQPLVDGSRKSFTVQAIVYDLEGRTPSEPFKVRGVLEESAQDAQRYGVNFEIFQEGNFKNPNIYLVRVINLRDFSNQIYTLDANTLKAELAIRGATRSFQGGTLRVPDDFLVADGRDGTLMVKEYIETSSGGFRLVRQVRNRASGSWEEHPELSYLVRERLAMTPIGFFDADPNKLYVSTNRGSNFAQIRVYDIVSRTWESEPAFASPEFDIVSVSGQVDRETKTFSGPRSYTVEGPMRHRVYVDEYWAPIQKTLENQFRGHNVTFASTNTRLGRAVVMVSGPRQPPVYYLLNNAKELKMLGKERPTVNTATFGEGKYVTYKARDGMMIPAFLTLPVGYNKTKHGPIPLVVHPHGGPWARDYLDWDATGWTQFMTTRGYAVLQPQYRGSDGWGMALWKAGDKEWGQKMQDDKDDGAAWLVAEGIADPKRMALFGYSYGGFAAVAASVRPGSPYQCAIAGAPVSDLLRLENEWGDNRIAREVQGWTVKGMNPINNVDKANIPILVYHGDHDRQADTVHSRDFYSAMKSANKDIVYHEIPGMWHQLPWYPEWHRESLGYIENFLKSPKCFGGK